MSLFESFAALERLDLRWGGQLPSCLRLAAQQPSPADAFPWGDAGSRSLDLDLETIHERVAAMDALDHWAALRRRG